MLRDAAPKASDTRVKIEVEGVAPATDPGPAWEADRIRNGVLTWVVDVPAKGRSVVRYATRTSFPTGYRVALH